MLTFDANIDQSSITNGATSKRAHSHPFESNLNIKDESYDQDIILNVSNAIEGSAEMFIQRVRRVDFIIIYSSILIVSGLFLITSFVGLRQSPLFLGI